MTYKQAIAYGSLFLTILVLIAILIFRKPVIVDNNDELQVYKDSITTILNGVEPRDAIILKRNAIIDSLTTIVETKQDKEYVKSIQYINNPAIPIRELDSIVRSIAIKR